ncbi:MAG: SpoIID/LytB domain-containing protein [candidate division Zixibacteria bacterium]|nr:SpoIID/LytB domain-containing protein [candidate division Zixibacteria bacterium]
MLDYRSKSVSFRRMTRLFVRIGTGLILLVLMWSCGTIPGLQEESVSNFIRVPFVRVLLEETTDKLVITAESAYAIECLTDGEQEIYYSSRPVAIVNTRGLLSVTDSRGDRIQSGMGEVNIIPRGNGNRVKIGGKRYRGIMRILPNGQSVRAINVIYMEDYLRGVVPPEIGPRADSEIEAVKAQAVAARTYAMAHLKQYAGQPYDMKSSIMDQLYEGVNVETRLVNKAIDATAGVVISFQDNMINAYYHSTCGGRTDDIEEVWERQEVGYLKAVDDSSACSWSKYFTWREVFTERQLRGRIEQYLSSDRGRDLRISPVTNVVVMDRSAGGRIKKLLVHTETDVYHFSKDKIRWVVGRTSNPDLILPSSNFDVVLDRDGAGKLTHITFNGRGYGHGVGMCQCGAIGHARDGWGYERILTLYYTGTEIKKLY